MTEKNEIFHKSQGFILLNGDLSILAFDQTAELLLREFQLDAFKKHGAFPEFFSEDKKEQLLKVLTNALNGSLETLTFYYRSGLSGVKIFFSPVLDENGEFSKISLSILELNDSKELISREETLLRAIIDNIPDYIFVKDRQHKSILSNKKFYENVLKKTSDQDTYGQTPMDYFERGKAQAIIADNEHVMKTGIAVINRPDIVQLENGTEERVLLTKVPIKNDSNEVTGLVGIARNITEKFIQEKKRELVFKIVQSFANSATLNEAMTHTLKLICNELKFDYAEAYKISVNKRKLVRTSFWPQSADLNLEGSQKYLKGEGFPGEVWESGKVKYICSSHEFLKGMTKIHDASLNSAVGIPVVLNQEVIAILCLASSQKDKDYDIPFLQEVAIQIATSLEGKRSQDQLNDLFNYSANLIAIAGLDGYIKVANPKFEKKFGYSKEEILSIPLIDFVHPEDRQMVFETIQNVELPQAKFEVRCKTKQGNYLWISWRFSDFFEDEKVVYIFGTDITPIKKIQHRLELSEEKYRNLFDVSPLPMWVLSRDNLHFLSVNKAAIDLYGYTENEFLNMTVKDLWAPNQENRIMDVVNEHKNEFFEVHVKHLKKSGELIYVAVESNPLVFAGVEARVSLVNDITAMVEAEKKLIRSEKRFKSLVQEGSDLISILDENFNYKYSSPAAKWVLGMEPEEVKGTNFWNYIHENDMEIVEKSISNLKEQKRIQLPSYRIKNKNGQWRWIETIITNLKKEEAIEGLVMNSRDITDFIEQERKLIESVKRYDIVGKATSDIITDYNIETGEMTVSNSVKKVLGYTPEEIKHTQYWFENNVHPEDYERVKSETLRIKRDKLKTLTIEYRFRCKDGTYKYILDRGYLILDSNNEPYRVISSMQDITERKQHIIEIENNNKKLKEIAWTQSHVVRAPLAKVMGLVDLLKNYKNDLDNIEEILENILNSANELDEIIKKIAVQTEEQL